jgi:processive 1,2-diacylglycerol beta-glucosyltransferase
MNIVVLTASTGNGHTSAARAIAEEAEARGFQAPVIDVLDHTPKAFRRWFKNGYEMLVRRSPETWGYLYKKSDKASAEYYMQTFLDQYCTLPLARLMRENEPDWVVTTHSVAQPRLRALRKRYGFQTAVVVTDLYPHKMWLRGRPDLYFVPGDWSQQILNERLPWSIGRTVVSGIPIAQEFAQPVGRAAARRELGIPEDQRVILLQSGGIGGGPIVETAEVLAKTGAKVFAVCGRHEAKRQRLRKQGPANVTALGQVPHPQMALYMQACDFMVAKAGGLTTCEALAVGTPFVVFMPLLIPGQEEGNAEFLENSGAGVRCYDFDQLDRTARELVGDRARRERMSEAGRAHGQPEAAKIILDQLIAKKGPPAELPSPLLGKIGAGSR